MAASVMPATRAMSRTVVGAQPRSEKGLREASRIWWRVSRPRGGRRRVLAGLGLGASSDVMRYRRGRVLAIAKVASTAAEVNSNALRLRPEAPAPAPGAQYPPGRGWLA